MHILNGLIYKIEIITDDELYLINQRNILIKKNDALKNEWDCQINNKNLRYCR